MTVVLFFKIGSHYVVLVGLEQGSTCLCPLRARIKGMHHHMWQIFILILCVYGSVTCVCKYPRSPEEGSISSKVGIPGDWEQQACFLA